MIPVIARSGKSFYGAFQYYFHDPKADTTRRVAWAQVLNMMTDCPDKAWKVMAYTAKSAERLKIASGHRLSGRRLEKPVFAYSLSWHPEQNPNKESMLAAAIQSLETLGLSEHEAMIVAHNDQPHSHLHVICNRVHPLTGLAANLSHSKRKLSEWARKYEREEGKVYCARREENYRKRRRGKSTRYVDPAIAEAWTNSRDAESFIRLLEEQGYQLARGRTRLVVVDPHGKTMNPIRHLNGVRAKELNKRMASLDVRFLPTPQWIIRHRISKDHGHDQMMPQRTTGFSLKPEK